MKELKNIVLIDDHAIVRDGLREFIEKLGPYKITNQYDSGESFLEAVPLTPEPNLIILDLNMPGMNGDIVIEQLNAQGFKTPVLVLTVSDDNDKMVKLFRLGVRGYLMKNCKAPELKKALNDIFDTGYYHNEFLTYSLKTNVDTNKKNGIEAILNQLSTREREFLKLVCDEKEYTYLQIADIMHVHHRTVDGYRESIFDKFSIKSKTGLVLFVLKHKLSDYL